MIITKELSAHGKINLFLKVYGCEISSGLHLINSLFLKIPLNDYIKIECEVDIVQITNIENTDLDSYKGFFNSKLTCSVEYCQSIMHLPSSNIIGENIIFTAIKKFAEYLCKIYYNNKTENIKIIKKFNIYVNKRIPISSGMGGGSSNAAIILNVLYEIFKDFVKIEEVCDIAKSIGSDILFFLLNKNSAVVSSTGGLVNEVEIHYNICSRLLLVNAGFPVSTKNVYSEFDKVSNYTSHLNDIDDSSNSSADCDSSNQFKLSDIMNAPNNLTEASCTLYPQLKIVLSTIKKQNGCLLARMSGSGGTCFGIFDSSKSVLNAAYEIKNCYPKWWVDLC